MSSKRRSQSCGARVEQIQRVPDLRPQPVDLASIPAVCFLEDVCRILRISRRTAERLRRHRAFPIAELPSLDKRPRWSGAAVTAFLTRQTSPRQLVSVR